MHLIFFVEEEAGTLTEFGGRFCGEILTGASTGEPCVHFWMTAEIVLKAGGDVLTLRDEVDGGGGRAERGELLLYLGEE